MKTCSVHGCESSEHAKGYCAKHYLRWKKHGDPLVGKEMRPAGSGTVRPDGYIAHGRDGGNVLEHVMVAERALGRPLPPGAQVHHWDGNRANNAPGNLVICPDQAYHRLLHRRADALNACGHADWMPCRFCKQHDDPANLYIAPNGVHAYHRACSANYARAHRAKTHGVAA